LRPRGLKVPVSEPAEPSERSPVSINNQQKTSSPKNLPWTAQRFASPLWFLPMSKVLKKLQCYGETIPHQHEIRVHFRLNSEVPELKTSVVIPSG
jgi:hypothetical protein